MTRQSNGTKRFMIFCVAATLMALATDTYAATITWQGGASDSWGTAANWLPQTVPQSGDAVVFPESAAGYTVSLDGDRTVDSISFDSNSSNAYTLQGDTLSLESGNITALIGGRTHTINSNVELLASGQWHVLDTTTLRINGVISESGGSFGFDKTGDATVVLSADNTFTGDVIITSGIVRGLAQTGRHCNSLINNTVHIDAGARLESSPEFIHVGALSGSGDVAIISLVPQVLSVGYNDQSTTFSGQTEVVGVEKLGSGTWTLTSNLLQSIDVTAGVLDVRAPQYSVASFGGTVNLFDQVKYIWNQGGTINFGEPIGSQTPDKIYFSAGVTNFEIGGYNPGVEHDHIIVAVRAHLGGTLNISYVDNFTASEGDEFRILEWTGVVEGQFTTVNFPDDQPWYASYDYETGALVLKVCTSEGEDCNSNGVGDACEDDTDGDGVIDGCDICPGFDDSVDSDGDGVPDDCDACPGFDDNADADGDGVCDSSDVCPGHDDGVDTDYDGVADGCDPCPLDNPDDTDGDGVCDSNDRCWGADDSMDADGDLVPDACELCFGDDATGDTDGDGKCDNLDNCPGEDDYGPDSDGDGLADICDICDGSNTGDRDGDSDVDALDLVGYDLCLTGPGVAAGQGCDCYDIEPNGEITIRDYGFFQRIFTGNFVAEAPGEINIQNIANGVSDKGIALFGENSDDFAGYAVALIGDMNDDGYGEMIVGAPSFGTGDREQAGRTYVIYGGPDNNNILLEDIANGYGGFALDGDLGGFDHPWPDREIGHDLAMPDQVLINPHGGPQGEGAGFEVASAGDVNGDGIADMIVTAPYAIVNEEIWGGRTYVVFGGNAVEGVGPQNLFDLTQPGATTGFMIEGERGICVGWTAGSPDCPGGDYAMDGDLFGWSADGARDVNGDGLADILVSAVNYGDENEGRGYAIFGKADDGTVDLTTLISSDAGIVVDFSEINGRSFGGRFHNIGDYTGDGLTDLVITPQEYYFASYVFLVEGVDSAGSIHPHLTQTREHVLRLRANWVGAWGEDGQTSSGRSLSLMPVGGGGDFDGDGLADFALYMMNYSTNEAEIVIILNLDADQNVNSIFGPPATPFETPIGGVRIYSAVSGSPPFGWSFQRMKNEISLAGDLNGDGYDDLVIAVGSRLGGSRTTTVVYGGPGSRSINLDTLLEDQNGFRVVGGVGGTKPGFAADAAGDVNGDGLNDLIIGDPGDDRIANDAGAVYLVYGGDHSGSITHLGDDSANTLNGTSGDDAMVGGRGDDTMIGNGGADTMYAGAGDDIMIVGDAGFHRIRGGAGFDTLATAGGVALDLETLRGRIDEIEKIDLGASGVDSLTVTRIDLLNLSPTSNQLFVTGTSQDEVISRGDPWISEGIVDVDGVDFEKFVIGRAELFVQDGIGLDFTPVIVTESLSVIENAAISSSLGFISVVDADGGQIVNYAIIGGDGQGTFSIDSATGEVFVASAIDFEQLSPPTFTLDVQVTDDLGQIGTATITVNVQDANEAPFWTEQVQLFTMLSEHAQSGLLVGTFAAVDPDAGDTWTYGIEEAVDVEGAFAIDPMTGELTVGDGSLLDFETQVVYELMVYAEDAGGLRSPLIFVSFTLTDVADWVHRLDGTFETTAASMWSTDGNIGIGSSEYNMSLNLNQGPVTTTTVLPVLPGTDFTVSVETSGQLTTGITISRSTGSVNATIPFSAEVGLPDEVLLDQQFDFGFQLMPPLDSPRMTGTTPAASADWQFDLTNFKMNSSVFSFGPENITNEHVDSYLTSSTELPWLAVVQSSGTLATGLLSTTLLELGNVDWNQYLFHIFIMNGVWIDPTGDWGQVRGFNYAGMELNGDYKYFAHTVYGSLKVDQEFGLQVNGYTAKIVFEPDFNPDESQEITIDGDTSLTLPADADADGDGRVSYKILVEIQTTFSNYSDFHGTIRNEVVAGWVIFWGKVLAIPGCPDSPDCPIYGPIEIGPLVNVNIIADFPFDLPDNYIDGETEFFPLGGFNTVVLTGAIDLN